MSITRNTAYNLAGFAIPTLLGLLAVPIYLALIGPARFGVLALAWLVLGYFGLFDLGLGRATSQRIAALRDGDAAARRQTLATSLLANLAIGGAGGWLLWPIAGYLFGHHFDLDPGLRTEALRAAPLLGLALPIATTIGVLSGALTGRAHFRAANRISITSTTAFQFLPLAAVWAFGPDLVTLIGAALLARMIGVMMLWRACRREFGRLRIADWDHGQLRALLAFGGWVTLTALFGPLLVFSDRFLIGTLAGAVAVTVYTVPMDAMRRLTGAALALAGALFPRLAVAAEDEAQRLSRDAVGAMYAAFTPAVAAALVAMDPLMRLWLGEAIGGDAAPLARLFLIATWLNCFAQVPYARLQASGRPAVVAGNLIGQLPFYLAALWLALDRFGLAGAAWVYLARIVIDTLALAWLAGRRCDHGAAIGLTLLAFCAAALWLDSRAALPLLPALGWAIAAGAAFLLPAWRLAPAGLTRPAERLFHGWRAGRAPF